MRALDFLVRAFGPAAQPFDLGMNQVFQRFLPLRLRVQKFFFLFQERAVASLHAQQSVGIDAAEFRHLSGDVLQKVAIVTDDHTGEAGLLQHLFEPLDPRQVEMIRGFIQQQDVGRLHQRLHDREALLPASGQRGGFLLEVHEARTPQGLSKTRAPLRLGHCGAFQCSIDHRPHRVSGPEFGFLLHVTQADSFADGDFSVIRIFGARENSQKGGLARAIGTDEPNAISLGDSKGNVLKERIGSKGFRRCCGH